MDKIEYIRNLVILSNILCFCFGALFGIRLANKENQDDK